MTILLVDDEPMLRALMEAVLLDRGYSVLTAGSGTEAMALFREHRGEIDLLISDIVMPGMDGPSLATALQRSCPDLKVLLISGYCNSRQLTQGFDFLPKPFLPADLLAKVNNILFGDFTPAPALSGRSKHAAMLAN